jgi:hypothetical protein
MIQYKELTGQNGKLTNTRKYGDLMGTQTGTYYVCITNLMFHHVLLMVIPTSWSWSRKVALSQPKRRPSCTTWDSYRDSYRDSYWDSYEALFIFWDSNIMGYTGFNTICTNVKMENRPNSRESKPIFVIAFPYSQTHLTITLLVIYIYIMYTFIEIIYIYTDHIHISYHYIPMLYSIDIPIDNIPIK